MANRVRRASARLALLVVALSASAAAALDAQRRREEAPVKPPQGPSTVRAELAAVLLQSKKYDEAAREYRALAARDPSNADYRIGLARALAWGGRPREAERELRGLPRVRQWSASVDSLLRSVRDAMEPTASEAGAWVEERPFYAPYRLAFARALAKQGFGRLAAAHYDTLLARGGGQVVEAIALRRERARTLVDGGDRVAAAGGLRDVLRFVPSDTAVRHELATILVDDERKAEARAQYDTLLAATPTAAMYAERARLRLEAGDRNGAEFDLVESQRLGSTVPTFLMLGDLYRERRDYASARVTYRAALARRDVERRDRLAVMTALAQMDREERPVAAFAPMVTDDPGWRMSTDGVSDNLGVHYAASTIRRTVGLGDYARVAVAAVHQYLGERSPDRSVDLNAVGGEASVAGQIAYGPLLGRLGVSGGSLRLPAGGSVQLGSATAAAWFGAVEVAVETATGPAYPSLLTTASLSPIDGDGEVLTERSTTETIGGPIGIVDFAVMAQQSRLSDDNRRSMLQGFLRVPLAPGVSVVYAANVVRFTDRSDRYWDPLNFVAHGAGLELATRATRGLSVAARAIPAIAWSRELLPPATGRSRAPAIASRTGYQLGTSGEFVWRDPRWEGVGALSYGRGRVGYYRSFGATLGFRILE